MENFRYLQGVVKTAPLFFIIKTLNICTENVSSEYWFVFDKIMKIGYNNKINTKTKQKKTA